MKSVIQFRYFAVKKCNTDKLEDLAFLIKLGERGDIIITKRIWIRSGIIEELDKRQQAFLDFVLEKIKYYYSNLYGTRPCYQHPLTIARLKKLCNRSNHAVSNAVRILANSIPHGSESDPPIHYDCIKSERNNTHRPYRIFLRSSY